MLLLLDEEWLEAGIIQSMCFELIFIGLVESKESRGLSYESVDKI